ncbi:MAG TPA: MFS transporter [Pirellulales bacterium]|nr:MFS transporter [Pirellulales bacterium]
MARVGRSDDGRRRISFGEAIRLGGLFGAIYFIQSLSDPNTGLISQPDNSLLRDWGRNTKDVATFGALLTLPWCLKPFFGMLSDFVPLAKLRRKSYLILNSLAAAIGFAALYVTPMPEGAERPLLSWLLLSSLGIIFCNVVVDGLLVETGQSLGITGRLQSAQWAAIHLGAIVSGFAGGILSKNRLQRSGFLLCGILMAGSLLISVLFVQEPATPPRYKWRDLLVNLKDALRSPAVLAVGAFAFVWSFNPFTQSVLYMHMTEALGYSDGFYGNTVSLIAVGALVASICYGLYCRRMPMRWQVHVSILAGIFSSWVYWALGGESSATIVSVVSGFSYMTGNMVLVNLAARACPEDTPATLFAIFMALCNVGSATGTWLGGVIYEHGKVHWSTIASFNLLVFVAGATTAACWMLMPFLPERLLATISDEE